MSRFQALAKMLGIAAEDVAKLSPEVLNTLEKVNTPEISTALKGAEREQYLNALDSTYGARENRAKDLGFGDKTWYHGTTVPVDEFQKEALGMSTGAQSAKKGFFFAQDPSTASDYAELAREKGIIREGDKVTTRAMSETETPAEIAEKKLKELQMDIMMSKPSKLQFGDYNMKIDGVSIGGSRYRSIQEIEDSIKRHQGNIKKYPEDAEFLQQKIKALENGKVMLGSKESQLADMEKQAKGLEDVVNSTGQNVLPVRLKGNADTIHIKDYKGQGYRDSTYADEMAQAEKDGKNAVLFKNTYDPADPNNRVKQNIAAVFEPEQIRSVNAAFDPRFKNSSKLLAGAGAVPMVPEFDPIGQMGELVEPITSRYEKLKAMITNPLAKELDLTKDGSATEGIQTALDIGADPVNFIPGAPGLAIGAAQMLGNSKKKENK